MVERRTKCNDDCPGDETCEYAQVCMCGAYMEGHDNGMGSGHGPVSMHDYYCSQPEDEKVGG